MKSSQLIQRLADTSATVFRCAPGTAAHENGLSTLKSILTNISAACLKAAPLEQRYPVAYGSIARDRHFDIGIFYLKKGEKIPLHDHPDMTVVSKVLYGHLRVRSFTWVTDVTTLDTERTDKLHSSLLTRFEPPLRCVEAGGEYIINGDINLDNDTNIRIVRPISGNIHELYAVTDTAFLDVLGPPYEEGVRDCHYYRDLGRREVVKAAAEHTTDTQKCRTTQIFSLWSPAHVAGNTSSISADEITSGGDEITRGDDAIVSGEDRPEDGESGQRYRYLANVDDGDFVCRSTPYIGYRPKVDNC